MLDTPYPSCALNLMLHGVGPTPQELETLRKMCFDQGLDEDQANAALDGRLPVHSDDALREIGSERFDVVLSNPPFGKKSSVMIVADDVGVDRQQMTYEREDFWATTSNTQLNFVQHIKSMLDIHLRAAVVVPDNALFEGGAGEVVRRKLLVECDCHTLLRLPTGIFYAQGVKANVLFLDRKPANKDAWTKQMWVNDLRTNRHFTLKTKRIKRSDLDGFVACFAAEDRSKHVETRSEENPEGRLRVYDYEELVARDKCSLDLFWLKAESLLNAENLPDPDLIAEEIAEDLWLLLEQIEDILVDRLEPVQKEQSNG